MQDQTMIIDAPRIHIRVAWGILLMIMFAIFSLMTPFYLHAQSQAADDISGTIKNALLTDPRAQGLSPEQMNALVNNLTAQAQSQGITSHDLLWRPALAHTITADDAASTANTCGSVPAPLCAFNRSVGLSGSDMTVILFLGVLFTLILALTAGYFELQHLNKKRMQSNEPSPATL